MTWRGLLGFLFTVSDLVTHRNHFEEKQMFVEQRGTEFLDVWTYMIIHGRFDFSL